MSKFTTLLANLRVTSDKQIEATEIRYRNLVLQCVADAVTSDEITSTLEATGHTLSELEAAVETERLRRDRQSTVARRDEVTARLTENHAARETADREFVDRWEALQDEHRRRVGELKATEAVLSAELDRIAVAERCLKVCDDGRLQEITRQLQVLSQREQTWGLLYGSAGRGRLRDGTAAQRERRAIDERRAALQEERRRVERELLTAN